ncbi:hypothetical protein F2P56_004256 [Juglans regia]|uniref:Uncharacterized protein n=2 Tax=Juglans regia TaxID=51240 RepID=A0A834D7V0_JUGRE|nr:uncharacterized mitochondrial protein AtMg00310-like [Juglans regia]KAF5477636.1 hypothetical protein F2P56_004256 [Juglans regia]
MRVFKLPKSITEELNRLLREYWWGKQENKGRIHWCAWNHMRNSKAKGGLGFRDLEYFNLALFAKQGWRLIQHPESLAAKIISAKYYPKETFLQAKLKRTASFIWRSIFSAKPLLEASHIWRIGDGRRTSVWKNKWLPGTTSHMIQSPIKDSDPEAVVASLID